MIEITANTRRAIVTNKELLTTGSAGIQVQFTLSEDWNGLVKLAVFRVGDEGESIDVALDSTLTCIVPSEVLVDNGEVLFIGIYGTNGDNTVIIPTIWASAGVIRPGTLPNSPSTPAPTPDIITQIRVIAQNAEETANDAYTMAANAQGYIVEKIVTDAVDDFVENTVPAAIQGIEEEGTAQVNRVQTKGDEVIGSIPQDYSDLTAEVDDLSRQLSDETKAFESVYTRKNILPIANKSIIVNGVLVTYSNGVMKFDGVPTSSGGRGTHIVDLLLPAGTYTLSRKPAVIQIFVQSSENGSIILQVNTNALSGTFTLNDDTKCYIGINVDPNKTYSNDRCTVQLEIGSTSTDFEPTDKGTAIDRVLREQAIKSYSTYTDLIEDNTIAVGDTVMTLGYYAENDGGCGVFKVQETIEDADKTLLYYQLNNGLYANCITDEIVLPRYGGKDVSEMVENAKPFMRRYQRNKVILPTPNANHPACRYYTESITGKKIYYWITNNTILIDENFSYSDIYLNGEIIAPITLSAILKVSDENKPEDINFITPVRIGGSHFNGENVFSGIGLLVEGCARLNFSSSLQAGFVNECIVLGGSTQNNTIEFFANLVEIGSWRTNAFVVSSSKDTFFDIKTLRIQNPLLNTTRGILGRGSWAKSRIGSCLMSASTAFDLQSITNTDNVLEIGTCRVSANNFGKFAAGLYNFGTLCASVLTENSTVLLENSASVFADVFIVKLYEWTLSVDQTSLFNARHMPYHPTTINGDNVSIGGYYYGNPNIEFIKDGLVCSPTTNKLSVIAGGSNVWSITAETN